MSFEKLEQEHNLINRLLIASGVSPASADFNIIKIHSLLEMFYEHAFVEGMTKQAQSSVDRAVNAMVTPTLMKIKGNEISFLNKPWQGLTDDEMHKITDRHTYEGVVCNALSVALEVQHILREKNEPV